MKDIVINKEGFAVRCEICHKDDLFNPSTNQCQRCSSLKLVAKPKKPRRSRLSANSIALYLTTAKILKLIETENQPQIQVSPHQSQNKPLNRQVSLTTFLPILVLTLTFLSVLVLASMAIFKIFFLQKEAFIEVFAIIIVIVLSIFIQKILKS